VMSALAVVLHATGAAVQRTNSRRHICASFPTAQRTRIDGCE